MNMMITIFLQDLEFERYRWQTIREFRNQLEGWDLGSIETVLQLEDHRVISEVIDYPL